MPHIPMKYLLSELYCTHQSMVTDLEECMLQYTYKAFCGSRETQSDKLLQVMSLCRLKAIEAKLAFTNIMHLNHTLYW